MMIAGTMGLLYARELARGYISGALGGLAIGAGCRLAAGGVAHLLGDRGGFSGFAGRDFSLHHKFQMVEEPISLPRALQGAREMSPAIVPQVTFDRHELCRILAVYGRMVAAGEWRDYALDFLEDSAV